MKPVYYISACALACACVGVLLLLMKTASEVLEPPRVAVYHGGERVDGLAQSVEALSVYDASESELQSILAVKRYRELFLHRVQIGENKLGLLLSQQTELETLELDDCEVGSSVWTVILGLTRLRTLSLLDLGTLSVRDLVVLSGHPRLERIQLEDCGSMTESDVSSAIRGRVGHGLEVHFKRGGERVTLK
jgi:hypothetical protein